ncbi:hypothetical protein [Paraliobacillus sp. X-1268]|uniref:hypothetical protein n=1 Tax=Paraliobacillus sp. X-1268 TaxID=2213193 RepID=UPI000E3BA85B|nr:hypothetical protein [Paraliobacillus sp. X-1268]
MIIPPSAYQAYRHVQKNRSNKKRKLYKLAFGVAFDKTILVYGIIFALFVVMIIYDTLQQFESYFITIEEVVSSNYTMVVILSILRPISMSSTRSGILFSSSEFMLSMLPYRKERLWLFCALNKNINFSLAMIGTGGLLAFLTPFSVQFLSVLVGIIIIIQWLMTIPQWVVYQLPWYIKWLAIPVSGFIGSTVVLLAFFISTQIHIISCIGLILVLVNRLLWKRAFKHVNWQDIIQTNDLIIWNMFFISKMSMIKIEPPKRRGMFHHLVRNKRLKDPFPIYNSNKVYHRICFLYFTEHKEQVIKGLGSTLITLIALSFHNDWVFGVGIAVSSFLYAQVAVNFFTSIFQDKLLYSLPWQMDKWESVFLKWVYCPGLLLLIVAGTLLVLFADTGFWIPIQLGFYALAARELIYFLLQEKINQVSKGFDRISITILLWIVLLFFCTVQSVSNPTISLMVMVLIILRSKTLFKFRMKKELSS